MDIVLYILLGILGVIVLTSLVASGIRWSAYRLTRKLNIKKLSVDVPVEEYARTLLDQDGLEAVEIKTVGFWASLFVGNTYSKSKKCIKLGKFTAKRPTITHLATACTLVGLAKMDADGQKGLGTIAINRYFSWLPFLMVPVIAIGLIIDMVLTGNITYITLIFTVLGFALTLFSFITSLISAKKHKMAYDEGYTLLESLQLIDEKEDKKIQKLFKKWKQLVVLEVFYNTMFMIYYSIKFVYVVANLSKRG